MAILSETAAPNSRSINIEHPKPRFLTIEQVAEDLVVKPPLVRGLIKSGELRAIQVGGRGMWRIGTKDLEDLIAHAYQQTADRIKAGDITDEN